MLIAATLTIPAVDTGYTLETLLNTAGAALPVSGRVAALRLQWENNIAFIVPNAGTITTTTGTTPDQYGFRLDTNTRVFEETRHETNSISLQEIVLAADTASTKVHVFAYSI